MFKDLGQFKEVKKIFEILQVAGAKSRFVGGCVRDSLMNKPIQDIDIATNLLPDKVESVFNAKGYKTLDVGKDFGTVVVILDSYPYEITTLRKDIETDGRRATSVKYTDSWDEDALRRDFTINAMSYCPYEKKLYDYFGGEKDLKAGIIKFVGDPEERVQEDFLRILRFFRFYTYYGKHHTIEQKSLNACIKYAHKIEILSGERKYYEFHKILLHKDRVETIELMSSNGVLPHLFKHEIADKVINILKNIDTLEISYKYKANILLVIFAIADFNNIELSTTSDLFRLANKDSCYLKVVHKITRSQIHDIEKDIYKLVYQYNETLLDAVLYLMCLEPSKDSKNQKLFVAIQSILKQATPVFPLKGKDLIKRFNLKPGPFIGKLMLAGEDFWCKSGFKASKETIFDFLQRRL
jgi:poly(A) polymerase